MVDASVLDGYEDDLIPLRLDLIERALAGQPLPAKKKKGKVAATPDDGLEAKLRATLERIPVTT